MPSAPLPSHLHLPAGDWATLLDGLAAHFARIPRGEWQRRFDAGLVQDDRGTPLAAEAPYREGQRLRYFREVADEPAIPFAEAVIHHDAHLVVADKPHFLPVTPSGTHVRETLLARLIEKLGNADLVPLHRLDRDTAGLVLFSADRSSRARYQALFRERRIAKRYEALAAPLPQMRFPLVHRSRIETSEPFFRMREAEGTPNSETHIDVIERGATHWRYALAPVTGRKHQLRLHMAALGAPILHDPLYPELRASEVIAAEPLQLLARRLAFDDPLTGEPRHFESRRQLA